MQSNPFSTYPTKDGEAYLERSEFDQCPHGFYVCIPTFLNLLSAPTQAGQVEVCHHESTQGYRKLGGRREGKRIEDQRDRGRGRKARLTTAVFTPHPFKSRQHHPADVLLSGLDGITRFLDALLDLISDIACGIGHFG